MGPAPSKPTRAELDALVQQLEDGCRDAAEVLRTADVLLLCTGAGFSADSGLAVYKDIAGLQAYEELGLCYHDICRPEWLLNDPELFYGFWGTCYNDYRDTEPHDGYSVVRGWRDQFFASSLAARGIRARLDGKRRGKSIGGVEYGGSASSQSAPYKVGGSAGAFFVYTSNVDGHSFDHFDPCEVRECHGNTELWQCGQAQPCCNRIWRAPPSFRFAVDERMRAPRDPGKASSHAGGQNGQAASTASAAAAAPAPSPPAQVPRATRLWARRTRADCVEEREAAEAARRLKAVLEGLRLQMMEQQILRRQRLDRLFAKVRACLAAEANSEMDALFKALDCDGKETMGFDQFCVLAEFCDVGIHRPELKCVFDDADRSGQGALTREQIAAVLGRFSLHVPGAPSAKPRLEGEEQTPSDEAWACEAPRAGHVSKPFGHRQSPLTRLPAEVSKESESSFPADSNWPHCPHCGGLARPAIQMFCDANWINFDEQEERWWAWRRAVCSLAKSSCQSGRRLRVMILEIGCGSNVPTVRQVAESAAAQFTKEEAEVTVVRVNPDYPLPDFIGRTNLAERVWHIGLPSKGLDVLHSIDRYLKRRPDRETPARKRRAAERPLDRRPDREMGADRSRSRSPSGGRAVVERPGEDEADAPGDDSAMPDAESPAASANATEAKLRPLVEVRLRSLKSGQLNGANGTVRSWDADAGRWQVELASGDVVRVKTENLVELDAQGEAAATPEPTDSVPIDASKQVMTTAAPASVSERAERPLEEADKSAANEGLSPEPADFGCEGSPEPDDVPEWQFEEPDGIGSRAEARAAADYAEDTADAVASPADSAELQASPFTRQPDDEVDQSEAADQEGGGEQLRAGLESGAEAEVAADAQDSARSDPQLNAGSRYNLRERTQQQRRKPSVPAAKVRSRSRNQEPTAQDSRGAASRRGGAPRRAAAQTRTRSAAQARRQPVAVALQDSMEPGHLLRRKRKPNEDSPRLRARRDDSPAYSEEAPLHLQEAALRGASVGAGRGRRRGSAPATEVARQPVAAKGAQAGGQRRGAAAVVHRRGAAAPASSSRRRGSATAAGAAAGCVAATSGAASQPSGSAGRARGGSAVRGPDPAPARVRRTSKQRN